MSEEAIIIKTGQPRLQRMFDCSWLPVPVTKDVTKKQWREAFDKFDRSIFDMSSYQTTAVCRCTGRRVKVFCWGDYFGKHRYGYSIAGDFDNVMNFDEFTKKYNFQDVDV